MRGLVAAVALAVSGLAQAQIIGTDAQVGWPAGTVPFGQFDWVMPQSGSSAALYLPLKVTGGGFNEDANTVAHITFNGSALVDSLGNSWSMNGTVPQVAANALPVTSATGAAGPYTAANSYQGSTSLMEWAGDWSVTVAFYTTSISTYQYLVTKLNSTPNAGWGVYVVSATGVAAIQVFDGGSKSVATTNAVVLNGLNVVTAGRSGGNLYVRLNAGASANVAAGAMTAAAATPARIGRYDGSFSYSDSTRIIEIIASTTPYSDALHDARLAAYTGMLGTKGEVVSLTRTTTRTCEVNGITWMVPAGMPCINPTGLLVERASTNYVLNNRTHPKTTESTGSITATQACVGWHEGTGTMTIANGTATTTGLSCTAVSPGTLCTFTVTVTGTMAITTSAGTVTKAQIECPGSTKTSEIPTAGTAVARNADAVTVTTPTGLPTTQWSVAGTFTPFGGLNWNQSRARRLWTAGAYAAANTVAAIFSASNDLQLGVVDNATTLKGPYYAHGSSTSSQSICAADSSGTISIREDGVNKTLTPSGAGTGILASWPATMYLGAGSSGGLEWDGYLRDFKIYKSPTCR